MKNCVVTWADDWLVFNDDYLKMAETKAQLICGIAKENRKWSNQIELNLFWRWIIPLITVSLMSFHRPGHQRCAQCGKGSQHCRGWSPAGSPPLQCLWAAISSSLPVRRHRFRRHRKANSAPPQCAANRWGRHGCVIQPIPAINPDVLKCYITIILPCWASSQVAELYWLIPTPISPI